jgi:hypothetical protein
MSAFVRDHSVTGPTVAGKEIGRVETHLNGLDDELSGGLRQSVRSETSVEPNTLAHQPCTKKIEIYLQSTKPCWFRRA